MKNLQVALTFFFFYAPIFVIGQSNYHISYIKNSISLDGDLREPVWESVKPVSLIQHTPNFDQDATENSKVKMFHNGEFLYIGAQLFDQEPDKIKYPSRKRDELSLANDFFGVIIDSYNDNENALCFYTTPAGLRMDMTIFEDAVGDEPFNISWNSFWDVGCDLNDHGWIAEFRIPMSSLQFQESSGDVEMGMILWRNISRKNEINTWPAIPPSFGFWSSFKPSQAQDVTLDHVVGKKPVYITPYTLGGINREAEIPQNQKDYTLDNDLTLEAGLDVKYNLTSNLTLDLTVNTDFAQVEADDQQVNLTRFSLFFPEKRLFFQERSSIFDVRMGGPNRLFYSRKIGLNEDGEQVRILGGARLTGRVGKYDIGLINMQTGKQGGVMSENFTVGRVRKRIINPFSYVGGLLTNRTDFNGNYNTVYAADAILKINQWDFLKLKIGQSLENDRSNRLFSLKPTHFFINLERTRYDGFTYDLSIARSGEDFVPGLGFQFRENYLSSFAIFGYGWTMPEDSWLQQHRFRTFNFLYQNNFHKNTETSNYNLGWEFQAKKGFGGTIGINRKFDRLYEGFELSDDHEVASGEYNYWDSEIVFHTPFTKLFRFFLLSNLGQFYNGKITSFSFNPEWNIGNGFELSGSYEFNRVKLAEKSKFIAHVGRLKLLYTVNTRLSLASFIQYVSEGHATIGNFRLRFNPKEGNDLYLVVNQFWNTNRQRENPFLPATQEQTVVVKYNYTFRL